MRTELWLLIGIVPLLHAQLSVPIGPRITATDASTFGNGVVSTHTTSDLINRLWYTAVRRTLNIAEHISMPQLSLETLEHLRSTQWSTIVSSPWHFNSAHINELELRSVLTSARWLSSIPTCNNTRILCLVDSAVTFYCLRKGRSSSPPLLTVLRKIAATLLASGITLLPVWIPSEYNPADAPSRQIA